MPRPDVDRLALAVRLRREELGLAQGDLSALGGPGVVTVGRIERGQIAKPQGLTLGKLDKALSWTHGSAAAVLAGGQATVTKENSQPAPETPPQPVGLGLDAAAEGLTREELEPVLAVVRAIKRAKGL